VTLLFLLAGCGPSSLTPVATGGSGDDPFVIATGVVVHNTNSSRSRDPRTESKLYVFRPSSTDPVHTFQAPTASKAVGAVGDKVWLLNRGEPYLVDGAAGRVVFSPGELADRHAPLASGSTVTSHEHPAFDGPIHRETGAIGILANRFKYVLSMDGQLETYDDFLKANPAELPTDLVCRGGRRRVCGMDACLKLIPDPSGGEKLEISASSLKPDAVPRAESTPVFGPRFVGDQRCIRRLGGEGPLVVAHQSKPGRNGTRDQVSAIDLSGKTLWTVPYADLFGDRERRALVVDLVEDRVVVGANVKTLFGSTVAVATIDADGTPHAAP
jgi:hypothetical protein